MTYSMVTLIIILITAFFILKSEANIRDIYSKAIEKQTCKTSVKTHAALKLRYADFSGELNCPTVKLKISDKNEDKTKKKLADAMFDCWDQFGRGKLELFYDDSVYCAICHRITFGKDIKVNGFTEYLATKQASGQKTSYLQFLTTEKTQNSEFLKELENKKIEDTMDASKNSEYAIIFTYIKGKKYLEEYAEKAKYAVPGAGVAGAGIGLGVAVAIGKISGIVLTAIAGTVATPLLIIGGVAFVASYYAGVPFEHIALISFIPYDAQNLENLNCKEIPIKQ